MIPSLSTLRGFTRLPARSRHGGLDRPWFRRGFTLIELIIVVAIIAVIAAGVFVALDPARRLNAGRNSKRWTDITAVLKAIKTFQTDSPTGALPVTVPVIDTTTTTVQIIGTNATGCNTACAAFAATAVEAVCVNFGTSIAAYLPVMPYDPSIATAALGAANSRYYINNVSGLITIGACDAQGEAAGGGGTAPAISVSN